MPTIHDIIPVLQEQLTQRLLEMMKAADGAVYTWEASVLLPASNTFLHYMAGVNDSLKSQNYISTLANLRGLIEVLGAVVYEGTARLPEAGYKRYYKKGRLPKWDIENKKWVDLGPRESVKFAQKVIDPKLRLIRIYDDCCKVVHFSSSHMNFLAGFNPDTDDETGLIRNIRISPYDEIPVKEQRKIIDIVAELTTGLGRCIALATDEKNRKSQDNQS